MNNETRNNETRNTFTQLNETDLTLLLEIMHYARNLQIYNSQLSSSR